VSRRSRAVAFSVSEADLPRLDRLVSRYGRGNRSEFLRFAMDKVEASERAERLRRLQTYGRERTTERGVTLDDVREIVHQVRAKKGDAVA
jgi:Arc/MetJ-type ribon-helix-helix transcriptional regulator